MEKKEEQKAQHSPEEVLEVVKDIETQVSRAKKGLETLIAYPEMAGKIDARLNEFNLKAQGLVQEALALKKEGKEKDAIMAIKKKKLVETEIQKLADKKAALQSQLQKEAGTADALCLD